MYQLAKKLSKLTVSSHMAMAVQHFKEVFFDIYSSLALPHKF